MYPEATVPVLQLSLRSSLSPREHIKAGRALAPLRDEGVLIVGSGYPSYHNIPGFFSGDTAERPSKEFDAWLTRACVEHSGAERSRLLERWEEAPSARAAHPREEHFIPLLMAVGAAEEEAGVRQYHSNNTFGRVTESAYRFGAAVEEP
jgi:aromatic ring-opening dioxygenase catalytic subunit (LigB family)